MLPMLVMPRKNRRRKMQLSYRAMTKRMIQTNLLPNNHRTQKLYLP
ncbi:hypothetical protein A2U01_0061974, partial [Trifolium medium]|nr:hypothetical protein [Trifolium medium]